MTKENNVAIALPRRRLEIRNGWLFIAPWVIGFLVFYLTPMLVSFWFTTTDYNPANPDKVHSVGLENWTRALTGDVEVWDGVGRIFSFTAIALPLSLLFSLMMALILNNRLLFGQRGFRTLFFLPTMLPLVATVIIWNGFLNEQTGWLNVSIESVTGLPVTGAEGLRWLASTSLIYWSYAFIGLWGVGNTILIFLAGLQAIPTELYEAAEVDGAGSGTRLFRITLPMLTPVIFYNLVIGVIGSMQYFLVPWVLNQGSGFPDGMSNFIMVYFFRQSFNYFNMGYGAVLAWIIFLIALLFTILLFGTSRRWVYYAADKQ